MEEGVCGPELPPNFDPDANEAPFQGLEIDVTDSEVSSTEQTQSKKYKSKKKKSKSKKSKLKKKKKKRKYSSSSSSSSSDSDTPRKSKKSRKRKSSVDNEIEVKVGRNSMIGPIMPSIGERLQALSGGVEEDVIGPLPELAAQDGDQGMTTAEFELRAQRMKEKLEGQASGSQVTERESWMTELPSSLSAGIGLSSRTFRKNAAPEQDAAWTDTPADRERKAQEQQEGKKTKSVKEAVVSKRDQEIRKQVEEYNKSKRAESLVEIHQKKMKKKKKKEKEKEKGSPPRRKAFDREEDLQVNKFDEAQRKSILKKAAGLNSRFGHGHSQYM